MWKRILLALAILGLGAFCVFWLGGRGYLGSHEPPGKVNTPARPEEAVADAVGVQAESAAARGVAEPKQVLFGDFHVHTTYSLDAFLMNLPLNGGEGAHPPADACDFARFCSQLDFWSTNDHAEMLSPEHWRDTVESLRQCNAVAQDPENPDTGAFLGWEWSQIGTTPDNHYGHKNVVLLGTGPGDIPARPIASQPPASTRRFNLMSNPALGLLALAGGKRYMDLAHQLRRMREVPICPDGVASPDLPADCREAVPTPAGLFRKLDEWDLPSIVIPHGTAWGLYSPPGTDWRKQLAPDMHDPDRQTLIEIYSGHGNSEEYRSYRDVEYAADGIPRCPEPRDDYVPTCWRAGEIIQQRCEDAGLELEECQSRAAEARRNAIQAGISPQLTVPGSSGAEFLDAGQCTDCWLPAFNQRPRSTAQYMLALRDFGGEGGPERFRMGFLGSSDNHQARGGNGFKEFGRVFNTESAGPPNPPALLALLARDPSEPVREPQSVPFDPATTSLPLFAQFETERAGSFFLTGGLVATHANGRDRQAIWDALERREVYATSGGRTLLWFDLVNAPESDAGENTVPMGGSAVMGESPRFLVRAAGAFEQKPGCPDYALDSLGPERLERLCRGECYHPSDRRKLITRIEVVRIRPQSRVDEPIDELIEDPWRVFECEPDPSGCTVSFTDEEFPGGARDAVYYVRAIEAPSPAVNGAQLRCEYDAFGRCLQINLCTRESGDCLAEVEERAWSSPIFVDFGG